MKKEKSQKRKNLEKDSKVMKFYEAKLKKALKSTKK